MLFCLGMAADIAAAHRHEFSPLPKIPCAQQNLCRPSLPYFFSSYSTSHTSVASSTSSTSTFERFNEPARNSKSAMLKEQPKVEASSKESFSAESAMHAKNTKRSGLKDKTFFQLTHSSSTIKHRQRFNIRSKLLLQLQQIFDSTRSVPVLDVLSSVTFALRLVKKFSRIFKSKNDLRADDLMIVRSQTYNSLNALKSKVKKTFNNDNWNTRDFVTAFCQVREDEEVEY